LRDGCNASWLWLFCALLVQYKGVTAVRSTFEHCSEIRCTFPSCPLCFHYLNGVIVFGVTWIMVWLKYCFTFIVEDTKDDHKLTGLSVSGQNSLFVCVCVCVCVCVRVHVRVRVRVCVCVKTVYLPYYCQLADCPVEGQLKWPQVSVWKLIVIEYSSLHVKD